MEGQGTHSSSTPEGRRDGWRLMDTAVRGQPVHIGHLSAHISYLRITQEAAAARTALSGPHAHSKPGDREEDEITSTSWHTLRGANGRHLTDASLPRQGDSSGHPVSPPLSVSLAACPPRRQRSASHAGIGAQDKSHCVTLLLLLFMPSFLSRQLGSAAVGRSSHYACAFLRGQEC